MTHIDPEDWPRCAKCNMPVEHFCVLEAEDALTLVAKCHGEREAVSVPRDVLQDMDPGWQSLDIGPAFAYGDKHEQQIDDSQRTQEAGTRFLS